MVALNIYITTTTGAVRCDEARKTSSAVTQWWWWRWDGGAAMTTTTRGATGKHHVDIKPTNLL